MLFKSIVYLLTFSLCFAEPDETLLFCQSLPPKLSNGLIKRDRVSYYNGQGYLGNMEYMCLPGSDLIGNRIVICRNGIWTTMPQCIPKKRCSPIKAYPSHTKVASENLTYFQNDPQQIIFGSTITFHCIDNYEFDPDSIGSLTIQCQHDGTWASMPSCRVAQPTCDYSKLYIPAHSRITRMNFQFSEHNRQLHTVGSNLEFNCEDGYRLHDGQTTLIVQCLDNGSWSYLPVCEFIYQTERNVRCNYPIDIKNSFITIYNVTIWEDQTYTGRIVYECNYGYETIDGNDQIVSDCIDGKWTNIIHCQGIATCPKQDLLEIESQALNSYVHNVSLQYVQDPLAFVYNSYVLRSCLPNFEHDPLSPPLKIQCQRDTNTWTGLPICRPTIKPTTTTTQMIVTESKEEDHLLILHDNFTINSNENQLETTTAKTDTMHTLFCHLNDIPSIPNAIINPSQLNTTYDIGNILFYKCQSGYELVFNQTNFIICLMDGTWSLNIINKTICQSKNKTTEKSSLPTSTVVSDTTEINNITINLDEILPDMNYSNESFTPSNRSISAGNRQIRHINLQCKEFPTIEHAQLLNDDTIISNSSNEITYSGTVLFICQYGYISDISENEPFRLTCQNGRFYPKVNCIEKPRCSLPPPIDTTRSSVVDSLINVFDTSTDEAIPGSFILLKCFDKTNSEESRFNMTCLDNGQWLKPPPPCIAPFKRRCQSGITIPNARTQIYAKLTSEGYYDDGSKATYRCLENFVHDQESGPLYIQCKNGRWGPRPRCIPSGCLEPLPDTIENGWKSGESYTIEGDTKYYQLTRYSCNTNAIMIDSSSRVIDIECRNGQWEYESLPQCHLQEEK